MKVKINSVDITIAPHPDYRTTKGGKRILKSDPAFRLNLRLLIRHVPEWQPSEVVYLKNIAFMYQIVSDEEGVLVNFFDLNRQVISFNSAEDVEVKSVARMYSEGQATRRP